MTPRSARRPLASTLSTSSNNAAANDASSTKLAPGPIFETMDAIDNPNTAAIARLASPRTIRDGFAGVLSARLRSATKPRTAAWPASSTARVDMK